MRAMANAELIAALRDATKALGTSEETLRNVSDQDCQRFLEARKGVVRWVGCEGCTTVLRSAQLSIQQFACEGAQRQLASFP